MPLDFVLHLSILLDQMAEIRSGDAFVRFQLVFRSVDLTNKLFTLLDLIVPANELSIRPRLSQFENPTYHSNFSFSTRSFV